MQSNIYVSLRCEADLELRDARGMRSSTRGGGRAQPVKVGGQVAHVHARCSAWVGSRARAERQSA